MCGALDGVGKALLEVIESSQDTHQWTTWPSNVSDSAQALYINSPSTCHHKQEELSSALLSTVVVESSHTAKNNNILISMFVPFSSDRI